MKFANKKEVNEASSSGSGSQDGKKNISKKSLKLIFIISLSIIVLAIILGLIFFIKNKNDKDSLVIGDTEISRAEIDEQTGLLDKYREDNPAVQIDGSSRDFVTDRLIMNAGLKNEAKLLNRQITDEDLISASEKKFNSDDEKRAYIETLNSPDQKIQKIYIENQAYQNLLADKLLAEKDYLKVDIIIDTPYFKLIPENEVQKVYDDSVSNLENNFLPLFERRESKESIGDAADINLIDDDISDDGNPTPYFTKAASNVNLVEGYQEGVSRLNELDDTSYVRGNVGDFKDFDDMVKPLKEVGDYTPVFTSKIGAFSIARLEAKNDGKFNSWDDMLQHYKNEYAKGLIEVSLDIKNSLNNIANSAISSVTSVGLQKAQAAQIYDEYTCNQRHFINFTLVAVDNSTGARLSGVKVSHTRSGSDTYNDGTRFDAVPYCGPLKKQTMVSDGNTNVTNGSWSMNGDGNENDRTIHDSCYNGPPTWSLERSPAGFNLESINISKHNYTNDRREGLIRLDSWQKLKESWHTGASNGINEWIVLRFEPNAPPPPQGSSHINSPGCDLIRWSMSSSQRSWYRLFKGSIHSNNIVSSGEVNGINRLDNREMAIDGASIYGNGSTPVNWYLRLYSKSDFTGLIPGAEWHSSIAWPCVDYPPAMAMSADCNVIYIRGANDPNSGSRSLRYYGYVFNKNPDGTAGSVAAEIGGYTDAAGNADVGWYAPPVNNHGYEVHIGLFNITREGADGGAFGPSVQVYNVGSCYSASCTVSVTPNIGTGVKANNNFTVNYSITNHGNAGMRALDASAITAGRGAGTDGRLSFGNQAPGATIGVGATGYGSFLVTAPPTLATYGMELYPNYGFPIGSGCGANVKVFQPFKIDPWSNTPIATPNAEDPSKIAYSAGVTQQSGPPIDGANLYTGLIPGTLVTTSLRYYDGSSGTPNYVGPDLHSAVFNNYKSKPSGYTESDGLVFNDVTPGPEFRPGGTWKAGDQFSAKSHVNHHRGWIGPGDELADVIGTETEARKTVLNYPYTRTYGGDVMSSSGDIRAYSESGASGVGSGTEFAALAAGAIDQYSSATLRSTPPSPNAGLSFPNIGSISIAAPDYFEESKKSDLADSGNVSTISVGGLADNQQTLIRKTSGKLVINGGTFTQHHAVFVEGDVVINSNIEYNDGWGSIEQIPAFDLIVKGNIYIANNVTRLDGTYIAQKNGGNGGKIYTCAKLGDQVDQLYTTADLYQNCKDNQLRVNGAFVADDLKLLRAYKTLRDIPYTDDNPAAGTRSYKVETYGPANGPSDDLAAESFRISPEYFLARRALKPVGGPTTDDFDYYVTLPPAL